MSKATDKRLGELHGAVAETMLKALTTSDEATQLLEDYGEELPVPVLIFLENAKAINPALLQAVTKFLKDNDITCAIDDSNTMSDLEKRLAAKGKRKAVGNVVAFDEDA